MAVAHGWCLTVACAAMLAGCTTVSRLDLQDPEEALRAERRIHCSLNDNVPTVLSWSGHVYSHVPGEPDRHLFDTEAFSMRACRSFHDDRRGEGYRVVAQEVVLYTDPANGTVLERWNNPWTSELNEVIQSANGPMSAPYPRYAYRTDGTPDLPAIVISDDRASLTIEKILFEKNPLGGDYQPYVGDRYHATEVFQFFMPASELFDPRSREITQLHMASFRVGPWLPWMRMGDRPGFLIYIGSGGKVAGFEKLPTRLQRVVWQQFPSFAEPPDPDDPRPRMNTWMRFRNIMEQRNTQDGRLQPGVQP